MNMLQGFTLSSGIGTIPNVEKFLALDKLSRNPLLLASGHCESIYSWGHKPYSRTSVRLSRYFERKHIRLEDGFICSFGRGGRRRKYSLVVDPVGIYYDAAQPSRLENILNGCDLDSSKLADVAMLHEAETLLQRLKEHNISKYNIPLSTGMAANETAPFVLVVDQTFGDQSVLHGGMVAQDFSDMLDEAVNLYGAAQVVLKVHPQVLAGKKQGFLSDKARKLGVRLVSGDLTADTLQRCEVAYVGTSLYGFELLMQGVEVVCFGQPFYASWGLMEDRKPIARRVRKRSLLELFLAAYLVYPTYVDPVSAKVTDLAAIVDHILEQKRQYQRVGSSYKVMGITPWKRRYVARYLMSAEYKHQHIKHLPNSLAANDAVNESSENNEVAEKPKVMVWGRKSQQVEAAQKLAGCSVARMEDGFVRSVGLGSNFTAPRSLIVDDLGIYFDATQPSRLEYLLQQRDCRTAEVQRATALIETLQKNRISKYTSAGLADVDASFYAQNNRQLTGKPVLLVVGQVQGDASLRFGADKINSNFKLLQEVRSTNPDACVVYKPHPDVVSGNRSDGITAKNQLTSLCDHVETTLPIESALDLCDEVHTMTSLAGMEALLCGKRVVTYGRPFYAGWGLTHDFCKFERRTRSRTLAELVYICYIVYPGYLDIESGEFTSVEKTIEALVRERALCSESLTTQGLKKYVNIVRNIRKGLTYAA